MPNDCSKEARDEKGQRDLSPVSHRARIAALERESESLENCGGLA